MTAAIRIAGVVGWPARHSLSPLIHRIWAEREGIDAAYLPIETEPSFEAFERAAAALMTAGFSGVNVTIPHKENALRLAKAASDVARRAGAANMLTFGKNGPYADNSDVAGFRAAILESRGRIDAHKAVVLGAGGAARAVLVALRDLKIRDIAVVNRTRQKSDALAKEFSVRAENWDSRAEALEGAGILVNATSLGMTDEPPLDLSLAALPAAAIVSDIVYAPLETPLLKAAKARGNAVADGLSMLMHQAAPAYRAFLGKTAVVDFDLRARLEAELARRAA